MIRSVTPAPRTATPRPQSARPVRAAVEPQGGGFSVRGLGDHLNLASSAAHLYNGVKTSIDGGRAVKPDALKVWKNLKAMKPLSGGMKSALSGIASASLSVARRSAVFAGVVSAVTNGYRLMQGQIRFHTFAGRVTGDTLGGFAGGVGAALVGGVGMAVLGTIGLAGTALTIGGAVAGMAGYMMAENWFRRTGIFRSVVSTVESALGGMSRPYRG